MSQTAPPKRPIRSIPAREDRGLGDPAAPNPGRTADPYDALTDLFLGEAPIEPRTERQPEPAVPDLGLMPETPSVEALILGHLPVLASAWATQYARQKAVALGGPVALLRLRGGEAMLDLIGGTSLPELPAVENLDDAVRAATAQALGWLIRVDETSEPRLADLSGIDAVTLLTGVDEAALVSSYRTIKQLFKPAEDEPVGPSVRLAIMGATPERADEASAKLLRATEAFLNRAVSVTACISRIGGARTVSLHRGPLASDADTALRRLVPLMRSAPKPNLAPGAMRSVLPIARTSELDAIPVAPAVAGAPVSRLGHAGSSRPGGVLAELAGYIHGLTSLRAACPYAPHVELAADPAGELHLLARASAGHHDAVLGLLSASAWAANHKELLGIAAQAQGVQLADGSPVLHLMTDDPKAVRRLGDAEMRLHLLARVEVAGQGAWYCTDLN
jgi:hypothetical protein